MNREIFTQKIRIPFDKKENDDGYHRMLAEEEEETLNDNECRSLYFRAMFSGGFCEQNQNVVTIHFNPGIIAQIDEDNWPSELNHRVLETHRPGWHVGVLIRFCSGESIDEIIAPFQGDDPTDKSCAISVAISLIGTAQYFVSPPMLRDLQHFIVKCCEDSWQAHKKQQQKSIKTEIINVEQTCTLWKIATKLWCPILQAYCRKQFSQWYKQKLLTCSVRNGLPRRIQLAFLVDTTGSMGACLGQLRVRVRELVCKVNDCGLKDYIEWAALSFGDYCDACQIRTMNFTQEGADVSRFISLLLPAGGGPTPEAYEWALDAARTSLSWRSSSALQPSSVTGEMPSGRQDDDPQCVKVLVIVGDSYPHAPSYTTLRLHWKDEVDKLHQEGIIICSVAAAGSSTASTVFMREAARRGKGIYVDMGATLQYRTLKPPHGWDALENALLDCLQDCKKNMDSDAKPEEIFSYVMAEANEQNRNTMVMQEYAEEVKEVQNEEWWKYGSQEDDPDSTNDNAIIANTSHRDVPAFKYAPSLQIWERL